MLLPGLAFHCAKISCSIKLGANGLCTSHYLHVSYVTMAIKLQPDNSKKIHYFYIY